MQWVDISFVFKHVFQNNLAHLYSLKSRSAIRNKLTKDPNLKKSSFFFFFGGGGEGGRGGCGARGSEHNVQMFRMALRLFKEYKWAKLF